VGLERLEGWPTSRGPLRLVSLEPGRFPEERDAVLAAGSDDRPVGHVKHFGGRASASVRPWIEALLVRDDEGFLDELVAALAELLPAGSHLMVAYGDDETERGLKRRFPPVATPVGKALFDAGCTWFKDWYYPEGWLEGGFKLQGNKPQSDPARRERLAELRAELEAWLAETADANDEDATRARERAARILDPAGYATS
jgi:hypothetical protein